ncbi:MAG TPA: FAD-binding protein, partial [Verrucomicrobiae bacterium]|nr:FAD-binding protein [Verrucomicrobiae bacterium]
MTIPRQKLPVTYLLLARRGRISRSIYYHASLLLWCSFYIFYEGLDYFLGTTSTWLIYPLFFWCLYVISAKRLHDVSKSGLWLLLALVPVIGQAYLAWLLLLKRGTPKRNRFGASLEAKIDYLRNDDGIADPTVNGEKWIINDVTKLNPILVGKIARPQSIEEVQELVRNATGPVAAGGGRFSMGGQTASPDCLHLDLRGLNRVLEFSKEQKWIRVQAGIRWCDIQHEVDRHDLSVKIMQSYANFTVGGAMSVNAHGRYMGLGPVILSIRWIRVVMADGSIVRASRTENAEIFFAAIGGYNGIGIIVEAELDLADNVAINRVAKKMTREEYPEFFNQNVRDKKEPVFHNGDMYPPTYTRVRSVTWEHTMEKPTVQTRLMPLQESYPINRYFLWSFTEVPLGRWRREFIIDPLLYFRRKVCWRNYEAGYDVAELEPRSRKDSTYVLLEYFVP